MRLALIGAAILTLTTAGVHAQNIKIDVPSGLALTTVTEPAPKKETKHASKGLFKELRPGSCKVTPPLSAPSSWPARGEPLISVCRP